MGVSVSNANKPMDPSYAPAAARSPVSPDAVSPASGTAASGTGPQDVFTPSDGRAAGFSQPYGPHSPSEKGGSTSSSAKSAGSMPASSPRGAGGKEPDVFEPKECKT